MNNWHLSQAAYAVNSGGVIAYPTEAVYGLGCLPYDLAAVLHILSLKHRPITQGLIIVAADIGQLTGYVEFPDSVVRQRVLATWPGPVTWVLPAGPEAPCWIRGQHNSIAVRVSSHPTVACLCRQVGPLVSTSANPHRRPPAKSALKVRGYFGQSIDYIIHGSTGPSHRPTEIRDAITGNILRSGG